MAKEKNDEIVFTKGVFDSLFLILGVIPRVLIEAHECFSEKCIKEEIMRKSDIYPSTLTEVDESDNSNITTSVTTLRRGVVGLFISSDPDFLDESLLTIVGRVTGQRLLSKSHESKKTDYDAWFKFFYPDGSFELEQHAIVRVSSEKMIYQILIRKYVNETELVGITLSNIELYKVSDTVDVGTVTHEFFFDGLDSTEELALSYFSDYLSWQSQETISVGDGVSEVDYTLQGFYVRTNTGKTFFVKQGFTNWGDPLKTTFHIRRLSLYEGQEGITCPDIKTFENKLNLLKWHWRDACAVERDATSGWREGRIADAAGDKLLDSKLDVNLNF